MWLAYGVSDLDRIKKQLFCISQVTEDHFQLYEYALYNSGKIDWQIPELWKAFSDISRPMGKM